MSKVIGISGKSGSNKLFYAFRIMRELKVRGKKVAWLNFADPLYEEFNAIAKRYTSGASQSELIEEYNLGDRTSELFENIAQDLGEYDPTFGYNRRNEAVRRGLDVLGSNIRRSQNKAYFIEKLEARFSDNDFVVVTDLRYPNEADYIRLNGGMTIRLEVVNEADKHGGYKYNEGLHDAPEIALDNYPFFDYHFTRNFFNGVEFGRELEEFFALSTFKETVR